jgi:hypothetical protein
VHFDENLFGSMYEIVAKFHRDFVVPQKPPPPDGSDRFDEFLKRAYPMNSRPAIVATEQEEELMLRYAKLREASKRIDQLKGTTRQELVRIIGDSEGLTSASLGALTYRKTKDGAKVNWEMACTEAMELAGLCINAFQDSADKKQLEYRLTHLIEGCTQSKPGHRVLLAKLKGEAELEMRRLEIALDALTDEKSNEAPGE